MTALQRLAVRYNLDPATAQIILDGEIWCIVGTPTAPGALPRALLYEQTAGDTPESAAVDALARAVRLTLNLSLLCRGDVAEAIAENNAPLIEKYTAHLRSLDARLRLLLGLDVPPDLHPGAQ